MTDTNTGDIPTAADPLIRWSWNPAAIDVAAALKALRVPFPSEVVGILPKQKKRNTPDSEKSICPECGAWVGPHIHLDFIGWAAVVDRILDQDLYWNWEPMGTDEHGLPAYRESPNGNEVELWIWLTIGGVTRSGVGIVDKGAEDLGKKLVSDALKNAANKFGIALYLWTKDELESLIGQATGTRKRKPPSSSTPTTGRRPVQGRDPATDDGEAAMSARDRNKLITWFAHLDPPQTDPKAILTTINHELPQPVSALVKLSAAQGAHLFALYGIGSPAVPPRVGGEQTEETV